MKARIIIEIVGSPKEHVDNTLKMVSKKLQGEKKIKVLNEKFFEAKKVDRFFSAFSEIELEVSDVKDFVYLCFDYSPSSVEIFDPEKLEFKSVVLAEFLNDLLARLHKFDMVVKNIHAENVLLKQELAKYKDK